MCKTTMRKFYWTFYLLCLSSRSPNLAYMKGYATHVYKACLKQNTRVNMNFEARNGKIHWNRCRMLIYWIILTIFGSINQFLCVPHMRLQYHSLFLHYFDVDMRIHVFWGYFDWKHRIGHITRSNCNVGNPFHLLEFFDGDDICYVCRSM